MLLFNGSCASCCYSCLNISIHLMLLFNDTIADQEYQKLYFNTSNVTIQLSESLASVSSLYFNTSNVTIQPTILSHLFYSQFHYTHYISTFS